MQRTTCIALIALAALGLAACSGASDEDTSSSEDAVTALANGAGAGPEKWSEDPCENPRAYAHAHGYRFKQAAPGQHRLDGTPGKDLLVGTDGDDEIFGFGGEDVICAGYGEDKVHGGAGNDYIDGGGDNDELFGDEGDDVIHGRGGSDTIHGNEGDDEIFGDILDDKLFGDGGDDLLIGGHGTDTIVGGTGNDYMRGDTGNDSFDGGPGHDIVSFATAMPPGQPNVIGKKESPTGVRIDFKDKCGGNHDGCANGDGGNEPLDQVEVVIGSPYDDVVTNDAQSVRFIGGYGNDTCDGQPCGTALPPGAASAVFVTLDDEPRDTGVVVVGTKDADDIEIVRQKGTFAVVHKAGPSLVAGPGCNGDAGRVECPAKHVVRYVAAWMGAGDDTVKLAQAAETPTEKFPLDMTTHVSGGDDDDTLEGGDEQDVLFSGPTGRDHLYGNAGDDALLSESRKWPAMDCANLTADQRARNPRCDEDKPAGAAYTDGEDELYGGPGDDQLVADYPCGHHLYSGGGGPRDIAGFARSGRFDLYAQLAGGAKIEKSFHGKAYNPQLCGVEHATRFTDDLEILEAADGNDELWGNDAPNTIWGREGDDHIHGLGGDDDLEGTLGDDWLYGGAGNDKLLAASGNNHVFQDAD